MKLSLLVLPCLSAQLLSAEVISGTSGDTFVDTMPTKFVSSGSFYVNSDPAFSGCGPDLATKADVMDVAIGMDGGEITNLCFTTYAGGGYADEVDVQPAVFGYRHRLLHFFYDSSDRIIGEPMSVEVAVAMESGEAETAVDTRPDGFALAAAAGGPLPLAYSSEWATNGVPAAVEITRSAFGGGRATVLSVAAPAEGTLLESVVPGGCAYTLSLLDGSSAVLESWSASCRGSSGMILYFK